MTSGELRIASVGLTMWRMINILWRHSMLVIIVVLGCQVLISPDNGHTLTEKFGKKIEQWSMQACLLGFFYNFSSPFFGKSVEPNYANFSRWYIAWILGATLYHFPSFEPIRVDLRMNFFLYLTASVSSILFLAVFHIIYLALWKIGVVSLPAGRRSELWSTIQNCAVLSIACCVFYSHCENRATLKQSPFLRKCSNGFSVWKKEDRSVLISKIVWMNEFKDEICSCWFAPVGSANDYPLWTKLFTFGRDAGTSNEISPLYSLWATFVGLNIANYVVGMSVWPILYPPSAEGCQKVMDEKMKPEFKEMVPWYSGTSDDLYMTGFNLLVSVNIFLGRFDLRMLQAATSNVEDGVEPDLLYNHFKDQEDFWFDFVADTGDGGDSSYSIARLLAQRSLDLENNDQRLPLKLGKHSLKRGKLLLIGGDLAYPNPCADTYKDRFISIFEDALQPPIGYESEQIPVNKHKIPSGFSELKQYDGPQAFIIPGNHDWFDGLRTFMTYICHKSWLGGWFMPQKKSYFALQLPKNWWVLGLDLALNNDIDADQFIFFSELVKKIGVEDSVIILTHEPDWLLDWYGHNHSKKYVSRGEYVSRLIRDYLKRRCKLRIAGDLHHYMRHSCVPSHGPVHVQHLLVNGCGGAFLHPTHVFGNFKEYCGATYETKASYPSVKYSKWVALWNILKFRETNWQFDIVGGIIYFVLAFSMFPQCNLNCILSDYSVSGHWRIFFVTVWAAFKYLLEQSYVSLAGALLLLMALIAFTPKVSWKKRVMMGVLHVSAHLTAVLMLMLLMEFGVEACISHKLLATSGYQTLYQWYRTVESEHFPDPTGLRVRMEQWTFGLYPACIKYLLSAFDVLEVMAVSRTNICRSGMESLSRGGVAIYYASVFVYFWVFSTPVVSVVFGSYLYLCVNWFHLHYDEAFSSLRIANHKGFTRFHINNEGGLEVYTLVVDKVPKKWETDRRWWEEQNEPERRSHLRKSPSKWSSKDPSKDPVKTVRIVDYFVIPRNCENHQETPEPAQPEPERSLRTEKEKEEEARRKKGKGKLIEEEPESSGAWPPEREKEPIRDSDDMWPRGENHQETPVSEPAQPEPEPEPEQSLRSETEEEEEARRKKGKGKLIEEELERSDALPPEREKEPIRDSDDERSQGEGKKDDDREKEQNINFSQAPEKKAKAQGEPSEKNEAEKGESTNRQVMSAIQELKTEINKVGKMIRSSSCFNLDSLYLDRS